MLLATFRQFTSIFLWRNVPIITKGVWLRRHYESDGTDDKDNSFNDEDYESDGTDKKGDQLKSLDCNTREISGGGLQKSYCRLKEEQYFTNQNLALLLKLRDGGKLAKYSEDYGDWAEFEKTLSSGENAAIRETGSLNKHKNCMEEAYFLGEQQDCVDIFKRNSKIDSVAPKVSPQLEDPKIDYR